MSREGWPGGGGRERRRRRDREAELVTLLGPGGTDLTRAMCGKPQGGRRQKGEEPGQSRGCGFYWGFHAEGKAGQGAQLQVSLLG